MVGTSSLVTLKQDGTVANGRDLRGALFAYVDAAGFGADGAATTAGGTANTGSAFFVCRYDRTGAGVPSFGGECAPANQANNGFKASATAVRSDGSAVAAGTIQNFPALVLVTATGTTGARLIGPSGAFWKDLGFTSFGRIVADGENRALSAALAGADAVVVLSRPT